MRSIDQRIAKAEGQVNCGCGIRHVRKTNIERSYWITQNVGFATPWYCAKCEPDVGTYYESIRAAHRTRRALETRDEQDQQQVNALSE